VTDAHDHLLMETPAIPGSPLSRQSAAAGAAQDFKAAGGRALVQWTPPGMGRHAEWLPGIAGEARIHIIAATGVHQARHYSTAAGPPALARDPRRGGADSSRAFFCVRRAACPQRPALGDAPASPLACPQRPRNAYVVPGRGPHMASFRIRPERAGSPGRFGAPRGRARRVMRSAPGFLMFGASA
jgi:hypothetical protein